MTKRLLALGGIVGIALSFSGCDNPTSTGNARVRLLLTDAPGDLVSAEVRIDEIYLQGGTDGGGGKVVLYSGGETFDLLELRDGVTAELSQVLVPAGTYGQLRLRLASAQIETEDGRVFSTEDGTLHCPSCAQSGLKINFTGGGLRLDEGDQRLVVDFDVAQSFGRERGQSGRWVLHPVMTATRAEAAGAIEGTVVLGEEVTLPVCGGVQTTLAHFVPTAVAGEVSLSAATDEEGAFRFHYVPADEYTMGIREEVVFANDDRLVLDATPNPTTALVSPGSTAAVDYTITSASCDEAA
jgi:hypothetical protein